MRGYTQVMARQIVNIIIGVSLISIVFAKSPHSFAELLATEVAMQEAAYGEEDAPLQILEFASLGCSHCAAFHEETFPKLKSDYIDKGMVRLIFNDFPVSTPALAATMIARCEGPERYLGMVEVFFKGQKSWVGVEDVLGGLKRVARFGGVSAADVDKCLENQSLLKAIQEKARAAEEMYKVKSTPSFVINGSTYAGNLSYEKLKKLIDDELKMQ